MTKDPEWFPEETKKRRKKQVYGKEKKPTKEQKKMAQEELSNQLNEVMNVSIKTKESEKPKEIILEEQKQIEKLREKPLTNILTMIIKKHTGHEKEIKTSLTGFLYILRILSTKDSSGLLKVVGSSSAGKSNLVKTLLSCFLDEWIKEVGDLSENAIKYIQWKNEKILYIKEASGAEKSTEKLKLMDSGDGGFIACVTRGSPSEGFWTEEIKIPVKFIITTRTEGIFDPQLENRMFALSIDESGEQTFNVLLYRCKDFAGHMKNADFRIIKKFISQLKPFDEIIVPYSYEFLNILEQKKIRVRRDIEKILSLCQTSAFINQSNRPIIEVDGRKILFTTPEDAYNIFILAFPSFQETLSGLTDRLQRIYDAIDVETNTYRDIAKKLGSYKRKVMRDIESLDNLGLVDIDTSSNAHRLIKLEPPDQMKKDFENYKMNLLAYTGLELSYYLKKCKIPLEWYDINESVKYDTNRDKLLQNNNPYLKNRDNDHDKGMTKKTKFYEKEEILDYFGKKKEVVISHFCYSFVTLNVTLPSPYKFIFFKYCDSVTNSKREADIGLKVSIPLSRNVTDQKEDIKKLHNFVKLESDNFFKWDDELKNYIKKDLKKQNPEAWIEKQKQINVLEEPLLGKLRFLVNIGDDNQ